MGSTLTMFRTKLRRAVSRALKVFLDRKDPAALQEFAECVVHVVSLECLGETATLECPAKWDHLDLLE